MQQEPELEAGKTVGEEIEKAVSEIRGLLKEYEEVRALYDGCNPPCRD